MPQIQMLILFFLFFLGVSYSGHGNPNVWHQYFESGPKKEAFVHCPSFCFRISNLHFYACFPNYSCLIKPFYKASPAWGLATCSLLRSLLWKNCHFLIYYQHQLNNMALLVSPSWGAPRPTVGLHNGPANASSIKALTENLKINQ